ncbi:hypothetical protein OPQ81_003611 [Rhizoctonia solani]|nr:hypothetical protein OPQ81_003611 [Rhizoctonia solani]
MNRIQLSSGLASQSYVSYLFEFGSTILLGIAVIFTLYNPASKRVSTGLRQWLLAGGTVTGNGETNEGRRSHGVPMVKPKIQKLYSLLIGIDTYPSLDVLKGAVNDANDMARYLMSDLGIPPNQVVNLRNEEATRKRIIQEIQALSNNPNIEHGDPIMIYYAGHGGLAKANKEWKDKHGSEKIQVIFPFDYLLEDLDSAKPVNCIPDKTIAVLLNELAAKKGDNITVIFDSCHSASGTRDNELGPKGTDPNRRERSANVEIEIPADIDDYLFASGDPMFNHPEKQCRDAELLLFSDQTSHVHLAACGIRQKAIEENGRGVFTAALLKKIRESRVDKITYHNLLKSLEMASEDQSPQCYGKHQSRILFNSRIPSRNLHLIPADFKGKEFMLRAGEASGVTVGSIWELHQSPTEDSPSVGRFRVSELYSSVAILEATRPISGLPGGDQNHQLYAWCVQVGPGNELKVWLSPSDRKAIFQDSEHVGGTHESGIGYVITPTRDIADVVLEVHRPHFFTGMAGNAKEEVVFYWRDKMFSKYGAQQLNHRKPVDREQVETVLFAAAKWRWYLRRGNSRGRLPDTEVTMSMLKVANKVGRHRTFLSEPEPAPTNIDGVVDFVVNESALYGFNLNSRISWPLYVRMFYFDATNFSIGDIFGHNTSNGENIPSIASRGQFLIGSGADGGSPVKFNVSPGNGVEVGYMKVFWSTEPLELDSIEQISAFKLKPGDMRGADVDDDGLDSEWGTICLPLILRESFI